MLRVFLIAALVFAFAAPARAVLLDGADQASVVPGSPMIGAPLAFLLRAGIPTEPLSERLNAVKAAAGYFRFRRDIPNDGSYGPSNGAFSENDRGPGLAVAWTRGFGPRWGMSATAGYARTSGGLTKAVPFHTTADGPNFDQAATLGVDLVYDPYGGAAAFRLPLVVGAAGSYVSGKRGEIDFVFPAGNGALTGHSGQIVERYSGVVPSVFLGVGPQGDVGDFRLAGFLYAEIALRRLHDVYTERDLTTGAAAEATTDAGGLSAPGLSFEACYRPWGLGLVVAPPLRLGGKSSGTFSAYSLAWSKRW